MATVSQRRAASQRLLTPDDLAEFLGVRKEYVHKTLVYQRRLDYIKVGGRVRFTPEALDRFLEQNTREAAS